MQRHLEKIPDAWKGKEEKLFSTVCKSYGIIWGEIVKSVVNEFGEKGEEAIKKAMKEVAKKQATKAFESGRYERNAKGFGEYMKFAEETLGMLVELKVESNKKAIFRWLKCPLFEVPKDEIKENVCNGNCEFEITAGKICNPKLKVITTKLQSRGDDCCEMVFELED